MRTSKVLKKLRNGQVAQICATSNFIPYFPHLAAHFGYDGVWVDAEHRNWNPREIEAMMAQHHLAAVDCIWRTHTLEKASLSRLLEDGATALMMPQVNTADRAKELVTATKFPPLGDRGLDGAGIDAGFWVKKPADYPQFANRETFLIVQIETPLALQNVDAIAAVDGVEVLFLGPGDLSLRLGCKPSLHDPKLRAALDTMIAAAKKYNKPWGLPVGTLDDAKLVIELGCRFLVFGYELWGIHNHLEMCRGQLKKLLGET